MAAALRDVVAEWGLDNCTVRVFYDNDTQEEFADHELCLVENFSFGEGDHWSASYERYCWEPLDFEPALELDPETGELS